MKLGASQPVLGQLAIPSGSPLLSFQNKSPPTITMDVSHVEVGAPAWERYRTERWLPQPVTGQDTSSSSWLSPSATSANKVDSRATMPKILAVWLSKTVCGEVGSPPC